MPRFHRSTRRIKPMLLLLFSISLVPLLTVSASHLPPLVRDYTMGTLTGNQRELNIVVNRNNPDILAAGANERPGTQHWYVSTDGGRNWTNGVLPSGTLTVAGTTSTAMSDPSLDFGANGEIYYAALMHGASSEPCTLFVTVSQNQGTTWTDPATGVVAAGTTGPVVCQDKEHILVDRLNNDNVYVAWTPIGGTLNREAVFSRDLNGITDGLAFLAPTVLSTDSAQDGCLNQGADFAEDAAGTLYIVWTSFCSGFANGDAGTVFVVRSTNQGGTWSAPVQAATLDNADSPVDPSFRARSHPSIDVDQATGRVFVVYATNANTSSNSDPDIMIVSSPNGTAGTWTTAARVNQDAGTTEQVLPWIDVGNGRIHVVFSSRAGDGSNWTTQLAYATASATPAFTEIAVGLANTPAGTGFLGDYHGAIVGTDDVLHPAWGDGRTGVSGQTDAFTARVNFSPPTTLTVSPLAPSEEVGINVTFVATVAGSHGEAETFIPVTYTVISGGSPSSSGVSGLTDTAGKVTFTYTNTTSGVDTLHVFADFNEDGVENAGETLDTTVTWRPGPPASLALTPASATNEVDETHVVTATIQDRFGNATPNILARFAVTGANQVFGLPTNGSSLTDAAGQTTFAYVGIMPGDDTITAFADFNEDGVRDPDPAAHEPQAEAAKSWILPPSTPGRTTGGGTITTLGGERATFGFNAQLHESDLELKGHLTYQDHGDPRARIQSITIDALIINGSSAEVFGTVMLDGGGSFVFRLDVADIGEPGKDQDTFRLRLSNGYDSGPATLNGGNIQASSP